MTLELQLARSDDDAQWEQVTVTCAGAFSHTFDLQVLLPSETNNVPHPFDDPVAYGEILYAVLFPLQSPAYVALTEGPERVVLVCVDEDLDGLPWEYAYGPAGWLVCNCAFVRGLPVGERCAVPEGPRGLHVVAVAAGPLDEDLAPLNVRGEWTRLTEVVYDLDRAVTLDRVWPPTMARLREVLAGQQGRTVHFMGHGGQSSSGEALLCFERENGTREDIAAREFVQRVRGSVFLVTLNACESATPINEKDVFSNLARALVGERVPYALGMRFSIHDEDALTFARAFYSDLARGVSVEEALHQARLTLAKSERAWAVGNLVLYTSLAEAASGVPAESGESMVRDAQEDALRGIVGALPEVQGTFQGRIGEQVQLGDWLTGDRRERVVTIHSGGGQGKTALARVATERFAHAWPGGVWAISLETVPTRTIFVAGLARFLRLVSQDGIIPEDIEGQVLRHLRRRRTLLVLDNLETLVEEVRAQNAEAVSLVEFILQLPGERTSLLCTSRHQLGWRGERSLELSGLTQEEGAALFEQSAPERVEEIDEGLARQLSLRVDGHPLGLVLLGRAFNGSHVALKEFLADHERYLMEAEDVYIGVEHRQRKMYANVAYSVRWLSDELRATLGKLWVFHAPFLPLEAVMVLKLEQDEESAEASSREGELYALWQRGLLTREGLMVAGEQLFLYRLPPVMRPYVERYLAEESEREETLRRFGAAMAGLARLIYDGLVGGRSVAGLALLRSDDLTRGLAYVEESARGSYLLDWGWILCWLGDRVMAIAMIEQALEVAEGHDRRLEALAKNNLAMIASATGHPLEAQRLYEQALEVAREVGDRAGEGTTLNNLGRVYDDLGKQAEAQRLYEQALEIQREVGDRAGEGTTLHNLGGVYKAMGKQAEALKWYEEALEIQREVGNRAGEGTTLNNLGWVYDDLGKQAEALRLYEQALEVAREVGNRAGEGTTLHNVGMIYARAGRLHAALACFLLSKTHFEYVQSPANIEDEAQIIASLRERIGDQPFAELLAQVEPRAKEIVEQALQEKNLPEGTMQSPSIIPAELLNTIVNNTVVVMTIMPERRAEWRDSMAKLLHDAEEREDDWQSEIEFCTAVLALLDGQSPELSAANPYASSIASIQYSIANPASASEEAEESAEEKEASEGEQIVSAFIQASATALQSSDPQVRADFAQQLTELQTQVPDEDWQSLFQAVQQVLAGADPAHIGDNLTDFAAQMWTWISEGMESSNPPTEETSETPETTEESAP